MFISLQELGRRCKTFRNELGLLQSDVARETGYSVENISSFETGRNDNARILLWYVKHGLTAENIFIKGV